MFKQANLMFFIINQLKNNSVIVQYFLTLNVRI